MKIALLFLFVSFTSLAAAAMAEDSPELDRQVEAILPPHPGACVLAIDHGVVVFKHAWGLADAEAKTPCTPATNFRIASVSKQFTAAAAMLLVDRGQLSLDDTLERFFPGFPEYGRKITVRHLLTHTSGLPAYEDLIPKGTTLQLDDLDVVQILMDTQEPKFPPGEKFAYSNSSYALLGMIVEIAADKPFQDFLQDEVFRPLGMHDSVMYVRGLNEIPRRALGHEPMDGNWVRSDQSLTSAVRGDGGVYTSLEDYRKWLAALDAGKLLSKNSHTEMFSPHVRTDRNGNHYGYGWFLDEYRGEPRIHHNGETHGFRACVQRFPARQAAVFFQLNGETEDVELTKIGEKLADLLVFHPAQ